MVFPTKLARWRSPSPPTTLWDIYDRQMYNDDLGYPIWNPCLSDDRPSLSLGSVVYKDYATVELFSTVHCADEQPHAPPDHTPYHYQRCLDLLKMENRTFILGPSFSSQGQDVELLGGEDNLYSIKFRSSSDQGSLLMLQPPAMNKSIVSQGTLKPLMREHFDSWLELANTRLQLGLKDEDLHYVAFLTNTFTWAIGSVHGEQYAARDGLIIGDFDRYEWSKMIVRIGDHDLEGPNFRWGGSHTVLPDKDVARMAEGEKSPAIPGHPLFMSFFKMKRRLFRRVPYNIKAGAGPHTISRGGDDDDEDNGSCSFAQLSEDSEDSDSMRSKTFDPVGPVLDYILENSEAEVAIASSAAVPMLFRGIGIPDDIRAALQELKPPIVVDEQGTGLRIRPSTSEADVTYSLRSETVEDKELFTSCAFTFSTCRRWYKDTAQSHRCFRLHPVMCGQGAPRCV
ncbi:uncharacterized protein BXZ73DRAFT_105163 [Epithele typhae]|uniref:uncharacterized protein n=1 Tax=Epithele typhae TaxID=378194 RepID=UPI0020083205|nr:uncharacterized protein BXZ73DRAFT_105699 [Epithele typhae]XP_047874059.1 uncharacterized protein BXZ73DRAFT_105163 [Epithele typhae]KAH9916719.1 hypothetical protein BXZ73DRAFT_105699 [Epithele typhae]KAH9918767.1 hypothetical protein BXZ73DRAFT_105163 [Epithele typhae]